MLNHLTNYLFQYRSVSIPHVGTFQIVQQPAQLNVVDKRILPPTYLLQIQKGEDVSEHQLLFLDSILQRGKEELLKELQFFGNKLHEKIYGPGFEWDGLGTITRSTQSLPLKVDALSPVTAERVIRQDVRHKVLVGDQQILSATSNEEVAVHTKSKRSIFVVIGWILLALSILFIALYLYFGKFKVNAAGSRLSPTSYKQEQSPDTGYGTGAFDSVV